MNALTGEDSAIVTDVPGTTRDLLREIIVIDGLPVHIVDTAGLRETTDKVEQEGIRRARKQIDSADHILAVREAGQGIAEELLQGLPADIPVTWVFNKTDLLGQAASTNDSAELYLSAKTGQGIDQLRSHLKQVAGFSCLLYTSPSPRDRTRSRMPSSA